MLIHKILFYIYWIIQCKVLQKRIPLTSSLILNDTCNLACKHCVVANLGYPHLNFDDVRMQIDTLYKLGARMLVITGGEPLLWKDGDYIVEHAIEYAQEKGFFRVAVCTNGTLELHSRADFLWVSLDGFSREHGELRGDGVYQRVIDNIVTSLHKNIYINFAISKINKDNFEAAIQEILGYHQIKGVLVQLITPYLGLEDSDILLTHDERKAVLQRLLRLKRAYPLKILNTFAGIKNWLTDDWKRPIWSSVVINQHRLNSCCCRKEIYNSEACKLCGCTAAVETWVLQQLKPSAILENFRFL